MKVKTLSALTGVAGAMILSGSVNAAFTGVSISLHTSTMVEGTQMDVYRLYANFSNLGATTQSVGAWGGSPTVGAATFQQITAGGGAGTGFYNNAVGGVQPPLQALVTAIPALQWDTFGTIGLAIDPGPTPSIGIAPSPGFPSEVITGTGGTNNNFSWQAGGQPAFTQIGNGPGGGRVMLAQFTVPAGQHVRGTVGFVAGFEETAVAGLVPFNRPGGTFNSVPAPGALALLGLAGLVGARRRRA